MKTRVLLVGLAVLAAACSDTAGTTTTAPPTPTTAPPVVTSTVAPPATTARPTSTTTTTLAPTGLDLAADEWVLHTIDGITLATGELVFDSDPLLGERNLVRDHEGGLIFTDTFGLWWWRAGEAEPDLVLDGTRFRLIEAIPTASGPVARLSGAPDRYVDLANLTEAAPLPGRIEIAEDGTEVWRAVNGLDAIVTAPEVTLDFEGFPDEVIEPAHLIVSQSGAVLLDIRIGGPAEAYARIHDFDGRRIIVSRGPYEPALPPEMFLVIDLECPDCTDVFWDAATTATLTGPDAEDAPAVSAPAAICGTWDPAHEGAEPAGLTDRAERSRLATLRAAAACDLTGLQYELDIDADVVLSHEAINRFELPTWLDVSPELFSDIDFALRQPWQAGEFDGVEAFVFPSWFAAGSWDELTPAEQAAMEARYGADAPTFFDDYFAVAQPGDLMVIISSEGRIIAIERPLS